MVNGKAETTVVGGKVFISMDDLLNGLFATANQVAKLPSPSAKHQVQGIVAVGEGLEQLHYELKKRHGLV